MVIVDPAFRPTHPAKPGRTLIAATGMLISLLLAFSLALGCALLDDRVYDRTDLERLELGAPTALVPTPGLSKARPGERGARSQLAGAALAPVEVSLSAAAQAAGPGDATDRGPNSGLPRVIVEALPTSPMGITRPDNPGTPDVRGPTARITLPFVKLNDPGAKTHILNPREASRPSSGRGGEKVAVQGGSGVAAAADSTVLLDSPAEVEPLPQIWVAKPTGKPAAVVDPRLILMAAPESVSAASFRVLRHRLEERGKLRILAVTSAESGEGKTTLAANLALALGEYGRARVLLVEANLRAPALAALFGFAPPEGFVAQLERHKRSPLEPWWVVEVERSLHVLAAHPKSDGEGRSLLDAPAFGLAIEAISRAGYDYIVFDTPPVLGSADVNLVQDWADGVLLSAWARRTSGRAIRRALEQLAPAKLVGLALLGA